jgi:plastocyanin
MSRRGKRRREARRKRSVGRVEPQGAESDRSPANGKDAQATAHAPASRFRASRKRRKRGSGLSGLHLSLWLLVVPVLAVGIGFLALGIVGGSSGTTEDATGSAPPDPRVAGLTPTASFTLIAGDDGTGDAMFSSFFGPDTITADAGELIEIIVENRGSVFHNVRFSGPDHQYDTADDFTLQPLAIAPGEQGRVLVLIEEPGTHLFRCDFHPLWHVGTLVLR